MKNRPLGAKRPEITLRKFRVTNGGAPIPGDDRRELVIEAYTFRSAKHVVRARYGIGPTVEEVR